MKPPSGGFIYFIIVTILTLLVIGHQPVAQCLQRVLAKTQAVDLPAVLIGANGSRLVPPNDSVDRQRSRTVTTRGHRNALRKWDGATRGWAHQAARDLVIAMAKDHAPAAVPYAIGLVPELGERLWAQSYVQLLEPPFTGYSSPLPALRIRPWLATSERIAGRLSDERLYWWRWNHVVGCKVDLAPGAERLSLDLTDGSTVTWIGAGVPPLAVVALWHVYGPRSLIDHPGVAVLRAS